MLHCTSYNQYLIINVLHIELYLLKKAGRKFHRLFSLYFLCILIYLKSLLPVLKYEQS